MSLNPRSLWHETRQQSNMVSITPVCLELTSDRASNLEQTLTRTQEELQWYRALYDSMPSVSFSLDATGIILSVNQFGASRLGYTSEQLIHQPIFNLFDQSDQERLSDAFIEILMASPISETADWEFRLNCPNSKITWVKVVLQLLPIQDKHLVVAEKLTEKSPQTNAVILMVCEDITDHKQAKAALKQSQEAVQTQLEEMESLNSLKEEFLSTVSHELRTPLTNMKMAIQMLGITLNREHNFLSEMTKPQSERSKAACYFEILDKECDREINLIHNFLDLQRLDTKTKPCVLEKIQVQQWLWRVVEQFKARNPNICQQNLRLNIPPTLPLLACDPFSLERILIELLTNASKFSPPDAEITIAVHLKSDNIQFQVINSGVEIPTSELPHIFNKFYRIPSNDPWKQGGTGLGLALVQKLTKYLGGTIEVESGSNRTCFVIQLAIG